MVEYKKSAAVLVFSTEGKLALHLRAAHDDSFPLHWDFSAGGGIDPGEDSAQCAQRELKEEIGIDARIEFLSEEHYQYPGWNPSVFRHIDLFLYTAHHDGPFQIDRSEIEKVEFFTLEEIKKMIESGAKFHPEFIFAWDKGLIARAAGRAIG